MSLFRILKGDSSRISTSVTPFHDGYAYFTPDDGGFYIDAEVGGAQVRTKVNGGSSCANAVLSSTGWSDGTQTVSVDGVTADGNGYVGVQENITKEQMDAICAAQLHVTAQGDGTITVTAFGEEPIVDIPIAVTILK